MDRLMNWGIPFVSLVLLLFFGFIVFKIVKLNSTDPIDTNRNFSAKEQVNENFSAKEQRLKKWEENARLAYNENRYTIPENDNAMKYVSEILAKDPTNSTALEIKKKIINEYKQKANDAYKKRQFDTAIGYYTKLLKLAPFDSENEDRLISAIALMVGQQQPENSNRLEMRKPITVENSIEQFDVRASEDLPKEEIQPNIGENISLDTIPAQQTNTPLSTENSFFLASNSKSIPSSILSIRGQNTTINPRVTQFEPLPSIKKSGEQIRPLLVIEGLLDSRRRKYKYRTIPKYPQVYKKMNYEGKVFIEVIVDYNGNIESYQVLKSDGEYFTESAITALKEFKYKPGTYQGNPVKFKLVEPFIFKRMKAFW